MWVRFEANGGIPLGACGNDRDGAGMNNDSYYRIDILLKLKETKDAS